MSARRRDEPVIYLDPEEAARQKARRAYRLNALQVPAIRVVGFTACLVMVGLHNQLILGTFTWRDFLLLALLVEGYSLIVWLLLYRFYARLRAVDLGFLFLLADFAIFGLLIYFSGGDRSWLFFLLVVRPADAFFLTFRRLMIFAHVSALTYALLLVYLAFVEQRVIAWPAELAKLVALYIVSLYLVSTARAAEALRRNTAAAVRMARDLIRQLEEAKQKAETASRGKSEFLANVSHELRTPLNGIIGTTHLALGTRLTPEQQEYIGMTKASAEVLLATVNDLLDLSKIEVRKLGLERVAFRARDLFGEAVRICAVEASRKGLRVSCEVSPDVPDVLVGDPLRLRQVVVNLVGNAVKFTEQGSVTVRVEQERRAADGVWLRCSVTDTGIGIPLDRQGVIFEAFAQADGSTARRFGGTGLGLTIAAELVTLMEGQLRVDSQPGRGSTFSFTARFGVPRADEFMTAPGRRRGERPGPSRRRLRVLVAEDNTVNRHVVQRLLEQGGHLVATVENGREAVAALRQAEYDLVLMDVQMPAVDGFEATAAVRTMERATGRHVPIVAVTAHAIAGDRERCLTAGMDAYLAKPIDAGALFDTIERLTGEVTLEASALLGNTGGNEALARRLAELFLEQCPRLMAGIRDAMARRDAVALGAAAHKLKGSVANFRAARAVEAATTLETMARNGDLAGAEDAYGRLDQDVEHLRAALAALVDTARTRSGSS